MESEPQIGITLPSGTKRRATYDAEASSNRVPKKLKKAKMIVKSRKPKATLAKGPQSHYQKLSEEQ